jgi:uncharacterized protein (DUF983 family)
MARSIDPSSVSPLLAARIDDDAEADRSPRRIAGLFARALTLHCPACDGSHLFMSWFRMKARCPTCGFALEREEGYFSGAMAVNLIVTEFSLTAVLVAAAIASWPLVTTWPSPPLQIAWLASIVAAGVLPLLFYPFAKLLWVAFDLIFRPPTSRDFEVDIPRVR